MCQFSDCIARSETTCIEQQRYHVASRKQLQTIVKYYLCILHPNKQHKHHSDLFCISGQWIPRFIEQQLFQLLVFISQNSDIKRNRNISMLQYDQYHKRQLIYCFHDICTKRKGHMLNKFHLGVTHFDFDWKHT